MNVFSKSENDVSRDLRIAYVDVNVRYLNRTREALIDALLKCGEVTLVGPGFSNGSSVAHLKTLLASPGKVDILVTTPQIALAAGFGGEDYRKVALVYRRSFSYTFPDIEFDYLRQLNELVTQAAVPKTLLLLESDYYNFDADRIRAFKSVADVILGFGPECWAPKSSMRQLQKENFASKVTDCWIDFLNSNGHRVCSLYHLIGGDEFCTTPLAEREYGWSVLGVKYAARRQAIANLRAYGVKPHVTSAKRKVVEGLKRLGLLRGESDFTLNLVQSDFHRKLCSSRYSYTCGSGLDMPIRKFFEIPAAGTVLVCRPFRGARQLGFVAGEHYLECEPQDILDVHRYLESNPDVAQRIAQSGQSLVRRLHSVPARAEQLRQSLEAVVRDGGVGRWCGGRFEIRPSIPLKLPQSLGCQQ